MQRAEDLIAPADAPDDADEFEDVTDDGWPAHDAASAEPQVPSYIAIIRIIAVLGMGLSISFGLFIMLIGLDGVLIGIPIVLLSIPCYFGMQLAERMVMRREAKRPASLDEP